MGKRDDEERGYRDLIDELAKGPREQPMSARAVSPVPPPPHPAQGPSPRPRQVWWRLVARLFLLLVNVSTPAVVVLGALSLVARTGSLGELSVKLAPAMLLGGIAGALGLAGFAKHEPAGSAKLLLLSGVLWSVVGLLTELTDGVKHHVFNLFFYGALIASTLDTRAAVVRGEARLMPLTARSYLVLLLVSFVGCTAYGACAKHRRSGRAHPGALVDAVDAG